MFSIVLIVAGIGLLLTTIGGKVAVDAARRARAEKATQAVAREDAEVIAELREQKSDAVQQIAAQLDDSKAAFLDDVERAVRDYIAAQGTRCLSIVERSQEDEQEDEIVATWTLDLTNLEYVKRLIAFCRNQPYDGHALDSALTDPVIAIVVERFQALYQHSGPVIAGNLLGQGAFAKCVARYVRQSSSLTYVSAELRSRAADVVLEQLQHTIEHKTGVAITASGLATVAASVLTYLYAHFGGAITVLVAKSLATPVVTKALILVMKKVVVSAIMATTAKAIALKLGIGLHAAVAVVLIPLILGLVAWDIAHFPSELGEKVAKQVRNQLAGTFAEVNTSIADSLLDNIIESFLDSGVSSIVQGWIAAPDVADGLSQLTNALSAA